MGPNTTRPRVMGLSVGMLEAQTRHLQDEPHFCDNVSCRWGSEHDLEALDHINGCPDVRNTMRGIRDFANDVPRFGATQSVICWHSVVPQCNTELRPLRIFFLHGK
jgi:hypothetical protein